MFCSLSDYGKLSQTARESVTGAWGTTAVDIAAIITQLNQGYSQSFYQSLMPAAWTAWRLLKTNLNPIASNANTYTCYYIPPGGNMALKETPFQDAAATGQFHFLTGFSANGDVQSETWVWGGSSDVLRTTVPSATFTNTLFRSTDVKDSNGTSGVGLFCATILGTELCPKGYAETDVQRLTS